MGLLNWIKERENKDISERVINGINFTYREGVMYVMMKEVLVAKVAEKTDVTRGEMSYEDAKGYIEFLRAQCLNKLMGDRVWNS